jgi:anaerobic ribonucleoside-triphosphate reductase
MDCFGLTRSTVSPVTYRNTNENNYRRNIGMEIELSDEERQPCEIWTRVMGYHRPTSSFNTGKKAEHAERQFFVESKNV